MARTTKYFDTHTDAGRAFMANFAIGNFFESIGESRPRQLNGYIFTTTKKSAVEAFAAASIRVTSAYFREGMGRDFDAMIAAGVFDDGAIYVTDMSAGGNRAVVRLQGDSITLAGHFSFDKGFVAAQG